MRFLFLDDTYNFIAAKCIFRLFRDNAYSIVIISNKNYHKQKACLNKQVWKF